MSGADPLDSTEVVVAACRRPAPLAALLAELAGTPAAVTVVNAGDDPGVRAAGSAAGARVIARPNDGYAASVNAGARGSGRAVVVFMNDDVLAAPGALRLLAGAVLSGAADVALPRLTVPGGGDEGTIRALPTPARLLLEYALTPDRPPPGGWGSSLVAKWRRPRVPEAVPAGTAAAVAVRASLLAEEPLPEAYFLYWEELEWFWRLRRRGARVLYLPGAAVVHAGGGAAPRPERERLLARNAVRCVRRTQGRGAALLALAAVQLWQGRLLLLDAARAGAGSAAARSRLPARLAGAGSALGAWRELR